MDPMPLTQPTPTAPGRTFRSLRRHPLISGMVLALILASAGFLPSALGQTNGARLGIGPDMPSTTTVGATNVAVYVALTNLSDPADGELIIPANSLTFTPSCGWLPAGAVPPCPVPDPGVFAVGSTGAGRAGSDCAGQSYAINQDSAKTGEVIFDGPAITLTASNPSTLEGGTCIIDFTVNVLKAPDIDADPSTPG